MMSLGTPDSPGWFDVASYLSQFLTDKRIINIPWLLRYVLVNLIIVPTRAFSSSKSYKELWTERGSPLKYHMEDLTNKVSAELSGTHDVYYAMRYKNPSIVNVLKEIQSKSYDEVVLFPVFRNAHPLQMDHFLSAQWRKSLSGTLSQQSKQLINSMIMKTFKCICREHK